MRIRHHTELVLDRARCCGTFSRGASRAAACGTIVLAQGRAPEDELWRSLEGRPECAAAGDVLGPRTIEEATLEGTLAVR